MKMFSSECRQPIMGGKINGGFLVPSEAQFILQMSVHISHCCDSVFCAACSFSSLQNEKQGTSFPIIIIIIIIITTTTTTTTTTIIIIGVV
jgi:hypothetical protein